MTKIRKAVLADAPFIANVHVHSWIETYSGLIDDEFIKSLPVSFNRRMKMWANTIEKTVEKHEIFVAEHDKAGVIGFVDCGFPRDKEYENMGEIRAIYLLKSFHGKGIGKDLILAAFEELKKFGYVNFYAWVLDNNPTLSFYKKSGAVISKDIKEIEIGSRKHNEIAVKWINL